MTTLSDELSRFRLDGKVAVVSGGTGAIGRRLSLAFAGVGAKVAAVGRSGKEATDLVQSIKALGSEALLVTADVTKKADADRAIDETMAKFGRVDIIVNAVGGGAGTALYLAEEYPEEEFDRIMDLNLRSDLLHAGCSARDDQDRAGRSGCCTSLRSEVSWASTTATSPMSPRREQ